jgi:hypothetical protein
MALQAMLSRAGDALSMEADVIELEMDGEYAEVVLGPRPTVNVRTTPQPDARVTAASTAIADFLVGQATAGDAFNHVSGDEKATRRLVDALS